MSEGGQISGSRALGLPCPALPLLVLPPHLGLQMAVNKSPQHGLHTAPSLGVASVTSSQVCPSTPIL